MQQAFAWLLGFHQFAAFLVGLGIRFGVFDHLFDLVIGQTARGLDRDRLFLAGALVLGA